MTQKARCRAFVFNQKKCPSAETLEHIVYIGKIQLQYYSQKYFKV